MVHQLFGPIILRVQIYRARTASTHTHTDKIMQIVRIVNRLKFKINVICNYEFRI